MDPSVAEEIRAFDQEPWIPPALLKFMRRSGLALLVLAIVGGTLMWQRYVSAPSPAQICEHKISLTETETAQSAKMAGAKLIAKLKATCESSAERRIRLEGKVAYARYARCVIAAKTLADTERC